MPLYLVATPIGNLKDISFRAVEVLRQADLVACEDTRKTGVLLKKYDIKKPLKSYHEHNEARVAPALASMLGEGKTVALVTNAGTPLISDPGYRLVRLAADAGVPVHAVPGANAALAALTVSGLPVHKFLFKGFGPRKGARLRKFLDEDAGNAATLLFYESPYRIARFLAAAREVYGNRRASVSREMTKKFEETVRGTLDELREAFASRRVKGEVTVVIEGHRE